ncbi:GGDEF domain-containing protein [Pleomorphomonas sp. JP5]|uniref:GGDEF domain-containing protein n=1 Tax=Pleomorphomonas sp. JP5 TaxID=2942998 RepID=UPI002043E984|nr:GGDEF domain-containing protein [Pleomorphomonas sp. JP5]MCM5558154.1 GGDEF domain-containing protein [Pleomorphomonas sp. JP5]
MSPTTSLDRRFFLRVILPMFGLIAVLLAGAMAGVLMLSSKQNNLSNEFQQRTARQALRHFADELASLAGGMAGRDETAAHVVDALDVEWISSHLLAVDAEAFFFVVGPDDRTLFSRVDGRVVSVEARGILPPAFGQLIARWRAGRLADTTTQLIAVDGAPVLFAISGVHAVADRRKPADDGYALVIGRRVDRSSLRRIAETFLLPNLSYEPAFGQTTTGPGRLRLMSQDGTMGDSLVWDPILPGDEIIKAIGPGLALVFAAYLVLTAVVLVFARRAVRLISVNEEKALHDPLTGLPNRLLLLDRMKRLLEPKRGEDARAAVFYLDLDGFKDVNDSAGHAAGDAVLVGVARRLREFCRTEDTVARLGGDEFVMVIPTDDRLLAEARAETVLAALSNPYHYNGRPLVIGVSIGIALAPEHGLDVAALLHKADAALYAAKQDGKGRVRFYRKSMRSEMPPEGLMMLSSAGI